jgi:inosine triphosphate pyrophosphatase
LKVPEIQASTPEEITLAKVEAARKVISEPFILEDTSLGFNALKGLPGPYM